MAGIGFALRALARQDSLTAGLRAHLHAAGIACGPWLFTIAALGAIWLFSRDAVPPAEQPVFSVVVIYNFAFSLLIAGPLVFVLTRGLADRIFARNVEEVPGMLVGALILLFAAQLVVAVPFYGLVAELTAAQSLLAIAGFLLVGGIWVTSAFLSALKSFEAITAAFAVGMVAACGLGVLFARDGGATGMLAGVTIGLALIFYGLVARILAEYPHGVERPFAFVKDFRTYWEFALIGLFYNGGVWIDKWIMWFAPGRTVVAGAMPVHPAYDTGMFFAMLTIVPAMTLFVVSIETRFFEHYLRFYRDIGAHVTAEKIRRNQQAMIAVIVESARNVIVLQTAICYLALLVAPRFIEMVGGGLAPVPIFRFAVLGGLFHVLLLFAMVVLFYLDLRRILLVIATLFLVLNGSFTLLQVLTGYGYPGYGYFLAAVVTLVYAYGATIRSLTRLPYLTFVANNRGLH